MGSTEHNTLSAPAELLAAVLAAGEFPACAGHPGTEADAICPVCQRGFCWSCISYDAEADCFRCGECDRAYRERQRRRRWLKLFRMPFFYIVTAVVIALISYALGIGNPTPSRLARKDAGRPWFTQELGMSWLKQADRSRRRAVWLDQAGRKTETAAWAGLAREAYLKSAAAWTGAEIAQDPALAAAVMTALAGDNRQALAELTALNLPGSHPSYYSWLYLRGRLALKAGDQAQALAAWNTLIKIVPPQTADITGLGGMIEKMAAKMQFDKPDAMVAEEVRDLCRTGLSLTDVQERITAEAKTAGLTLETPPRSDDLFGVGEGLWPEPEPPVSVPASAPAPPKPRKKLVIERFEPKK